MIRTSVGSDEVSRVGAPSADISLGVDIPFLCGAMLPWCMRNATAPTMARPATQRPRATSKAAGRDKHSSNPKYDVEFMNPSPLAVFDRADERTLRPRRVATPRSASGVMG